MECGHFAPVIHTRPTVYWCKWPRACDISPIHVCQMLCLPIQYLTKGEPEVSRVPVFLLMLFTDLFSASPFEGYKNHYSNKLVQLVHRLLQPSCPQLLTLSFLSSSISFPSLFLPLRTLSTTLIWLILVTTIWATSQPLSFLIINLFYLFYSISMNLS